MTSQTENRLFESTYKNLKLLVNNIAIGKCSFCGGAVYEGICICCGNQVQDEVSKAQLLTEILTTFMSELKKMEPIEIPLNKAFSCLVPIADKSSTVKKLLSTYSYQEKYDSVFKKIRLNEPVDMLPEELFVLETDILLGKCDVKNKKFREKIINLFIFFIINPQFLRSISYNAFKELVIKFVTVKIYVETNETVIGGCNIEEKIVSRIQHKDAVTFGSCSKFKINLSDEIVRMQYDGVNDEMLLTIFHELAHIVQSYYYDMPCGIYKDVVLSSLINGYYSINYYHLSSELQAEIVAFQCYSKMMYSFGMANRIPAGYISAYEENCKRIHDPKRIIVLENGEEVEIDINEYFDQYIADKPFALKRFVNLGIIYKIVDGVVVPKTKEEIEEESEIVKSNISMPESEKSKVLFIYQYILKGFGMKK